jgi:hypothetical protein
MNYDEPQNENIALDPENRTSNRRSRYFIIGAGVVIFLILGAVLHLYLGSAATTDNSPAASVSTVVLASNKTAASSNNNTSTASYDKLMVYLAHGDSTNRWPVKNAPQPLEGAILPYHRVISYYGNLYSNKMGALGKWPKQEMITRLKAEVKKWNDADTLIKAIPALHYIATTAQGSPGADGKYRFRMPYNQIDTVLKWAKEINAIVFIDIQAGLSDVMTEVKYYEQYLTLPNVHLGIDPEFAMKGKGGKKPGSTVGTLTATEINEVGDYLAGLVQKNKLPPKIFMVHRFTEGMVQNATDIKLHPELQVVMDMDGWGSPELKKSTYYRCIYKEPVQFSGFKLFYVNDTEKVGRKEMMSIKEVLGLTPTPVYIQYQ